MLKGSYTAIFASIIVHLLLLITLILASKKAANLPKQEKIKPHIIKSFLYKAPKVTTKKEVKPPKKTVAESNKKQPVKQQKPVAKVKPKQTSIKPVPTKKQPTKETVQVATKHNQSTKKSPPNKADSKKPFNFSSYSRLSRLRKKLDDQQRDKAFAELTQKRSASAMDGEQFPVPHSLKQLTPDEKYKMNTVQSGHHKITKNDNGSCTIHREQMLGSPIEATTSTFACGESKFNKSFREHMQKVRAKLGQ